MQTGLLLMEQIACYYIMIAMGYVIVRKGLLKAEDSRVLSKIMIYLAVPCVIIHAFQITCTPEKLKGFLLALLTSAVIHVVFILLLEIAGKVLHMNAVEKASVIYSNAGNMIIPVVTAVLGEEWVFYSSAYVSVQLIFLWSHGKALLCGEKKADLRKILTNVNMIAILTGIVLFVGEIRLPLILSDTISYVGAMMVPAGMLIIGMLATQTDWKQVLKSKRIYLIIGFRMIVCPVLVLILLNISKIERWVPEGNMILFVTFLACITPASSSITQMSQVYGEDAKYAGVINMMTTLICIVTMPVMAAVYQMLFEISL